MKWVKMNHVSREGACLPKEANSPHISDHSLRSADMDEINISPCTAAKEFLLSLAVFALI